RLRRFQSLLDDDGGRLQWFQSRLGRPLVVYQPVALRLVVLDRYQYPRWRLRFRRPGVGTADPPSGCRFRRRVPGVVRLLLPSFGILHLVPGLALRVRAVAVALGGKDKLCSAVSSGRLFSDTGTRGSVFWRL